MKEQQYKEEVRYLVIEKMRGLVEETQQIAVKHGIAKSVSDELTVQIITLSAITFLQSLGLPVFGTVNKLAKEFCGVKEEPHEWN